MFEHLRGRLVQREPDEVVLEVGGVGYQLLVSGATSGRLPAAGAEGEVTLFVHDMLREERTVLFGFASRQERALFLKLLTVSRVGPGMALSLLSALEPAALAQAVTSGDVAALSRVRGVGRRTAERLCVELKDRLQGIEPLPGRLTNLSAAVAAALAALGYPRATAQRIAEQVCAGAPRASALEDLVKQGLAALRQAGAVSAEAAG